MSCSTLISLGPFSLVLQMYFPSYLSCKPLPGSTYFPIGQSEWKDVHFPHLDTLFLSPSKEEGKGEGGEGEAGRGRG